MHTYSFLVDPADLCLKLCKAHEQNYFIASPVAHSSPFRVVRCIRNTGNVALDMAQRLEAVFWTLSTFHEVPGEPRHSTWFRIHPLGRSQSPCVFRDPCVAASWWAALGCYVEATSDLVILYNLGALQNDEI